MTVEKQSKLIELANLITQYNNGERDNIDTSKYSDWVIISDMLKKADIDEDIYEDFLNNPTHYKVEDGSIIYNENWLETVREEKYAEALNKAYEFQNTGTVNYKNCEFEMSDSNRKNLSDTVEALKAMGKTETEWNDKNDNIVTLTLDDIQYIRLNLILGTIQKLWLEEYPKIKAQIAAAKTLDELNGIEIKYNTAE